MPRRCKLWRTWASSASFRVRRFRRDLLSEDLLFELLGLIMGLDGFSSKKSMTLVQGVIAISQRPFHSCFGPERCFVPLKVDVEQLKLVCHLLPF